MEPEIIRVQADITEIQEKLDQLDQRFGTTEKGAEELGDTTTRASKKSARSIDEVTASLRKAEANQKRLTSTIREQEKITSEFRQEMVRLTKQYNEAGKSGTLNGLRIKKQMDALDLSIKDQVISVRQLKREQQESGKNIKNLKNQEKQIKDNTKAIKTQKKETSQLGGAMKKLGGVIAAAFAVERIVSFIKQSVIAADRARGIATAFDRTGASLDELRQKTRGVVSDVELMRSAVNARNLGVPVEELGDLLAFASSRARESGETIDAMVNSIVTGLGRKSTLVLDNLGISAVDLRDALGDVSLAQADVAQLTRALNVVVANQAEGLKDDISEIDRATASFQNLQVAIGNDLIPIVNEGSSAIADFIDGFIEISKLNETLDRNLFERVFFGLPEALLGIKDDYIDLQRSTEAWGESAIEAANAGNWQGAADDIEFLRDKLSQLEEGGNDYKIVLRELTKAEEAFQAAAQGGAFEEIFG
ncbi:MAG: hypothetical protein LC664_16685 [Flavobacteriales bacterium]|nr:hypothetical protein [Flavobacteriales bacterium]